VGTLRVLLLAEACNPEWTSVPLVGWNWYKHLRELADITLVTQVRNREAILKRARVQDKVVFIDSERIARPCHRLAGLLTLRRGLGWTTQQAVMWLPYLYFEKCVYDQLGLDLRAGHFDLIHRLTPLTPTYPSPLASWIDLPFVIGPLNGGLPWPKGTTRTRLAEMEFLSYVRRAYQWLPYVRKTYRRAVAVIAGSRHTQSELERAFGIRCHYMPENGIDPAIFHAQGRVPANEIRPFRILFVGRLVPYKGPRIVIEAFAGSESLRRDAEVVIVGDGPQRTELAALAEHLGVADRVRFRGALPQSGVAEEFRQASVFAFPSIREFGGAVVMEAMACGLPCVVVNHGGPGEYVTSGTGAALPVGTTADRIAAVRTQLETFAAAGVTSQSVAALRGSEAYRWDTKAVWLSRLYEDIMANTRAHDVANKVAGCARMCRWSLHSAGMQRHPLREGGAG
jgi:glycosyltransferase involved in cell wall biosynthesis